MEGTGNIADRAPSVLPKTDDASSSVEVDIVNG